MNLRITSLWSWKHYPASSDDARENITQRAMAKWRDSMPPSYQCCELCQKITRPSGHHMLGMRQLASHSFTSCLVGNHSLSIDLIFQKTANAHIKNHSNYATQWQRAMKQSYEIATEKSRKSLSQKPFRTRWYWEASCLMGAGNTHCH